MPPRRGLGFTPHEVQVLLTSIEKILPIGMIEWDAVLFEHERQFPEGACRTREGLKRKFASLYKLQMPTGDPNIPPDVLRAKKLYQEIKKKAEIAEGEEEEELEPDPDDESLDGEEGDADKDAGGVRISRDTNLDAAALQEVEEASLQMAPPEDPSHLHREVVFTQRGDDNNEEQRLHQRSGEVRCSSSTSISASATSTSTGQERRQSHLSAFSTSGGARIVSTGSKKKRKPSGVREEDDGTMNSILLFMANERKLDMEVRRQELEAAERARREEIKIRREELKTMNMFMMQMISNNQQYGPRHHDRHSRLRVGSDDDDDNVPRYDTRHHGRRSRSQMDSDDDDGDIAQYDVRRHYDCRSRTRMGSDNDDGNIAGYHNIRHHDRRSQSRRESDNDDGNIARIDNIRHHDRRSQAQTTVADNDNDVRFVRRRHFDDIGDDDVRYVRTRRAAPHRNLAMLRKKAETDDDHKLPDTQNFFNALQDATATLTPLPENPRVTASHLQEEEAVTGQEFTDENDAMINED